MWGVGEQYLLAGTYRDAFRFLCKHQDRAGAKSLSVLIPGDGSIASGPVIRETRDGCAIFCLDNYFTAADEETDELTIRLSERGYDTTGAVYEDRGPGHRIVSYPNIHFASREERAEFAAHIDDHRFVDDDPRDTSVRDTIRSPPVSVLNTRIT